MELIYFTKNSISHVSDLAEAKIHYIDLTVLISGTMEYTINGNAVELHSGDVILFQPHDVRMRKSGGKCEYYSINVLVDESDELPVFRGVVRGFVSESVMSMLKLIEQTRNVISLMSSAKSCLLFKALYLSLYENFMSEQGNDWIVIIKKYINENIGRKLCIDEISKLVFLTPNYCNSMFKKYTGQTLNKYITEQKILRAKYLLISTEKSLTDIATELGYDYSYFSRQFKKSTGLSPVQYRRKRVYDTSRKSDNM